MAEPVYAISLEAQTSCNKLKITNDTAYTVEVVKADVFLLLVCELKTKEVAYYPTVPDSALNDIDSWEIEINRDGWYRMKMVYAKQVNLATSYTIGKVVYNSGKFYAVIKATTGVETLEDTDYFQELDGTQWVDSIIDYIYLDVRVICNTQSCLAKKAKELLDSECKNCDPCKQVNNYTLLDIYYKSAIQYWDLGNKRVFQNFMDRINVDCCENC